MIKDDIVPNRYRRSRKLSRNGLGGYQWRRPPSRLLDPVAGSPPAHNFRVAASLGLADRSVRLAKPDHVRVRLAGVWGTIIGPAGLDPSKGQNLKNAIPSRVRRARGYRIRT